MQHSTIAAIATAPGAGGIAIVRLSGPESYEVAAKVFRPANPAKKVADAKGYTAMFGAFVEGEEAFDAVPYTHLKLPTKRRVVALGGV